MFDIFYFLIFVFGACIGSFLNCIIYRLEKNKSFLAGRSYCPKCKHILKCQDLIPIISFLLLKGRCRYCKEQISFQYPLVEMATGMLFLLIFNFQFSIFNEFLIFNFQTILETIFLFIIGSFLIVIFVYDLKHYIIPDKIIYPAIIIIFIYKLFEILDFGFDLSFGFCHLDFKNLLNPFFSAILASTFFLSIFLISRGKWLGFGDVKFAFFMGLFLGFPKILAALFFSFLIGAIIGTGLIVLNKKTLKSEVPFGPFLVIGIFIALFWSEQIINWYFGLLNLI